jgi:hypothetical protein
MEAVRFVCGIAGSLAGAYGSFLYIRTVRKGGAKPEFWTWAIFAIGVTGAAVYTWEGHAGFSGIIFPVSLAVLVDFIFLHTWSEKYKYRDGDDEDEKLAKRYHPALALAALVLYGLQVGLHWPAWAGAIVAIAVDFSALHILWIKCWKKPWTEKWDPWAWGALGGALGLVALQKWNFTSAAFPLYFAVTEAIIVAILLWRTPRVRQTKRGRSSA